MKPPLVVLVAHNYYQQPGGEDNVFTAETALLEKGGHSVIRYEERNSRITNRNSANAAVEAVWSSRSARSIGDAVRRHKPDIVHFHNTFPLISPAAYSAVRREGVPVVQTLHNFRLLCPGATLFRDGAVCEECIEKGSLRPAISHKCYRGSRAGTGAVATMLAVHRAAGTWKREVDQYIALSEFARRKFVDAGLPEQRIAVKPNFISIDPGAGTARGNYALFVGRLSPEKGIPALASAWRELTDIPLVVAGDGPLDGTEWPRGVKSVGRRTRDEVFRLMHDAGVLIFPSQWYECAPMAIIEAFATGLPVIASNLGSMAEMVAHERTGLLFTPGDPADLARKVRWAFEHPAAMDAMRVAARREYEEKYTAERNYQMLMAIYQTAIENFKRSREQRAAS